MASSLFSYPLFPAATPLASRGLVSWPAADRSCLLLRARRDLRRRPTVCCCSSDGEDWVDEMEQGQASVLSYVTTPFNDIMVVDTLNSRLLLLDSTNNVHSVRLKDGMLTGLYWDDLVTLPAIVPKGPIAILGLGAGTEARMLLDSWPSLHLEAWEIDVVLVDKAREYFGLSDLEKLNDSGGFLSINVDDAFSPSARSKGKFAGIIVDLFYDGEILPQLNEVDTWLELKKRLMPRGRIMVNCGGESYFDNNKDCSSDMTSSWMKNATVRAMSEAFPGKVWWKKVVDNYLALTGPMPDLDHWSNGVHLQLRPNVQMWKSASI